MAEFVATDYFVSIAANDLSKEIQSLNLPYTADAIESTAMSDTTKEFLPGLKTWTASITARNNFAAGEIDSILFPLVGTSVAVVFRPTSAVVGAGNPEYTGNAILTSHDPMNASVNALATTSVNLQGTGALARAVA